MRIKTYSCIIILWAVALSCKKVVSIISPLPVSSLTVVNAVDGSAGFLTTFWPDSAVSTFYTYAQEINYTAGAEFNVISGATPVIIYDLSDTATPLFNGNMTFQPNGIYSLFLSGVSTGHAIVPDTLLVLDNPPFHPVGDSSVGIRFVNVSPSAGTISVDLQGSSPGSEVTSLGYQEVTEFKDYAATSTIPSPSTGYVFEFRSVTNDSLLCTYIYGNSALPLFRNVSLVLAGTTSGSGIRVFEVNNY